MQVVRSGQETSSKLSQLVNDVSKIQSALKELEKRTDYHATKIQCVSRKAPRSAVARATQSRRDVPSCLSPALNVLRPRAPRFFRTKHCCLILRRSTHRDLHSNLHSKLEEKLSEAAAASPLLYLTLSQLPCVAPPRRSQPPSALRTATPRGAIAAAALWLSVLCTMQVACLAALLALRSSEARSLPFLPNHRGSLCPHGTWDCCVSGGSNPIARFAPLCEGKLLQGP
jgi:hypothetical protein